MNLYITSIIPIELFTIKRQQTSIEALKLRERVTECADPQLISFAKELVGSDCDVYGLKVSADDIRVSLLTQGSGLCLVLDYPSKKFDVSLDSIRRELVERNSWHSSVIQAEEKSLLDKIINEIKQALNLSEFDLPKVNYVFSFYTIESAHKVSESEIGQLKLLAEPSLLDLDDMLSTDCEAYESKKVRVKDAFLDEIADCDIAFSTCTFITWASIVSITQGVDSARNRALLTALECKLQLVWNQCYSVSEFIDTVFEDKTTPKDISELYWNFVKTLDDARAVISSTFSTRANRFFNEMVITSRLDGEIARLSQKIDLLEKYLDQKNERQNRVYQKSIELLLFVTALASLAQVLFKVPLRAIPEVSGLVIISVVATLGVLAIFKAK